MFNITKKGDYWVCTRRYFFKPLLNYINLVMGVNVLPDAVDVIIELCEWCIDNECSITELEEDLPSRYFEVIIPEDLQMTFYLTFSEYIVETH